MHRVKIVGVRTLETSKFDGESGEMENPCKGTIKWDKKIPLTEAGMYNNTDAWIMSDSEKQALTEGKSYLMPEHVKQGLKMVATTILDLLSDEEVKK